MATQYGIGHQCTVDLLADGSGRKCITLRGGAYVREFDPTMVALGTWNEFWIGARTMLKVDLISADQVAYPSAPGYLRYYWMGFSFGICAGLAGASAYTDVDGNTTHFLGLRMPLTSYPSTYVIPQAIGDKQLNPVAIPCSFKNGTIAKGTQGGIAFNLRHPGVGILRLVRSGGNLQVAEGLWADAGDATQAQFLAVMNGADWATAEATAVGYGWTNTTNAHTVSDQESTYGTLSHLEIGWWQNTTGLQVDMLLAKTL